MSMDQKYHETLSAWMDASAPEIGERMVDRLIEDTDLGRTWERYHLIGDVLRNEMAAVDQDALIAGIRSRLAEEPAILAPQNLPAARSPASAPSAHGWPRWLAGMGMAAGVAALVVMGVTRMEHQPGAGFADVQAPSGLPAIAAVADDAPRAEPEPRVNSKIDRYLAEHSKFVASGGSLNGMVPLATLVSHNE